MTFQSQMSLPWPYLYVTTFYDKICFCLVNYVWLPSVSPWGWIAPLEVGQRPQRRLGPAWGQYRQDQVNNKVGAKVTPWPAGLSHLTFSPLSLAAHVSLRARDPGTSLCSELPSSSVSEWSTWTCLFLNPAVFRGLEPGLFSGHRVWRAGVG